MKIISRARFAPSFLLTPRNLLFININYLFDLYIVADLKLNNQQCCVKLHLQQFRIFFRTGTYTCMYTVCSFKRYKA